MIPRRPHILLDLPPALEKRLKLIETLANQTAQDTRAAAANAPCGPTIREAYPELAALWQQWLLLKYSPDQPRVPAGNTGGGQWTKDESGGSGASVASTHSSDSLVRPIVNRPVQLASVETGTVTDATQSSPDDRVAAGPERPGYPIDLAEEEDFGHTIRDHVGKSEQFLFNSVDLIASDARRKGDFPDGLRAGSFPSLDAANKLVNATLASDQNKVNLVAQGVLPYARIDLQFSSPTGYEAYAKNERSGAVIRNTYGVRVIIVSDPNSPRGYRVLSAFPTNPNR